MLRIVLHLCRSDERLCLARIGARGLGLFDRLGRESVPAKPRRVPRGERVFAESSTSDEADYRRMQGRWRHLIAFPQGSVPS